MADELIDVLSPKGYPTREVVLKSIAHREGHYHASVHIWIYSKAGKILIQKRTANKDTFPNLWDTSVAGHISSEESPLDSALRELWEEVGYSASYKELIFVGQHEALKKPLDQLVDHELHYIYLLNFESELAELSLQVEEVSEVKWISLEEFQRITNSPSDHSFVPHDSSYLSFVHQEILSQIKRN